ncbi:MAG: ribosome small subunit-dependent GTPase A, partial [Planctomycetota bacterium]
GEGVDALRELLVGSVSAVYGPSGVGKSSLLNAVEPGLGQATREVSQSSGKGRHTTTAVTMHPLREGGFVVDTPGVRAFGFYDLTPRGLSYLFKDIRPYAYYEEGGERSERCRFLDCLHRDEPGCAVYAAVEEGAISDARYLSYLRILDSLLEEQR